LEITFIYRRTTSATATLACRQRIIVALLYIINIPVRKRENLKIAARYCALYAAAVDIVLAVAIGYDPDPADLGSGSSGQPIDRQWRAAHNRARFTGGKGATPSSSHTIPLEWAVAYTYQAWACLQYIIGVYSGRAMSGE
jgi:hypothetical protein